MHRRHLEMGDIGLLEPHVVLDDLVTSGQDLAVRNPHERSLHQAVIELK